MPWKDAWCRSIPGMQHASIYMQHLSGVRESRRWRHLVLFRFKCFAYFVWTKPGQCWYTSGALFQIWLEIVPVHLHVKLPSVLAIFIACVCIPNVFSNIWTGHGMVLVAQIKRSMGVRSRVTCAQIKYFLVKLMNTQHQMVRTSKPTSKIMSHVSWAKPNYHKHGLLG